MSLRVAPMTITEAKEVLPAVAPEAAQGYERRPSSPSVHRARRDGRAVMNGRALFWILVAFGLGDWAGTTKSHGALFVGLAVGIVAAEGAVRLRRWWRAGRAVASGESYCSVCERWGRS